MPRYILSFLLPFLFIGINKAEPPNWVPVSYSTSTNMVAALKTNDSPNTDSGNSIAAFVNGEVRGVAPVSNIGYYFLTIYSAAPSTEVVTFQVYIAATDEVYDIDEFFAFNAIQQGILYTLNTYYSIDLPPVLDNIPPQHTIQGIAFPPLYIDSFATSPDGDAMTWNWSGETNLQLFEASGWLFVVVGNASWVGTETIQLTTTESTTNQFSDQIDLSFTVMPDYGPPDLQTVPDQMIGLNQAFTDFELPDYLAAYPGDSLVFAYFMPQSMGSAVDQSWSVNSSPFQYNMNITARVEFGSRVRGASGSQLLAFIDGTLRGVAMPVTQNGEVHYFLTLYANTNGELIQFQFYDSEFNQLYEPVYQANFIAGGNLGSPANPERINMAPLDVLLDEQGGVEVEIEKPGWVGSQPIGFVAADGYQPSVNADTSFALFTVVNENAPELGTIPGQYRQQGIPFAQFDLDDYVTELDGDPIQWTVSGASDLTVQINSGNIVQVFANDGSWQGSEPLTFRATDLTTNQLYDEATALFTIGRTNTPPELMAIPEQVIDKGTTFASTDLSAYLSEPEGDVVDWSYFFTPNIQGDTTPNWTVNPGAFSSNMSIVAKVQCRGVYPEASNHRLAAFHETSLRGVSNLQQIGDEWYFFLTVYGNVALEEIHFQFYQADQMMVYPLADTVPFISQNQLGTVEDPLELEAGFILGDLAGDIFDARIIDSSWTGSDTVFIIARESGTAERFADTTALVLTIENSIVLPAELLFFRGQKREDQVLLEWEIGESINVSGYQIERSRVDGVHGFAWEVLGFLKEEVGKKDYEWTDGFPHKGANYYRLKIVDQDGEYAYSSILPFQFNEAKFEMRLYPNPTYGNHLTLEIVAEEEEELSIQISDAMGRIYLTNKYEAPIRQIRIPIEVDGFPAGRYLLRISKNQQQYWRPFVILKE